MTKTLYIVPAWSDQAGKCRIVVNEGSFASARDDYRARPKNWFEIGHINSKGELVCLEAPKHVWDELKSCEPLAAGLQLTIEFKDS